MNGRKSLTVYPGMTGLMENAFVSVKGVRHTIRAEIEVPNARANGVAALAPGKHTIVYEFVSDERKPGTGGTSILSVDGKILGAAEIARTVPLAFSAAEGVDVGLDVETAVPGDDAQGNNAFSVRIEQVTVEVL